MVASQLPELSSYRAQFNVVQSLGDTEEKSEAERQRQKITGRELEAENHR